MIEILDMQDVTAKDIRDTISYMRRKQADTYYGEKFRFDLAIEALKRLEVQHGER